MKGKGKLPFYKCSDIQFRILANRLLYVYTVSLRGGSNFFAKLYPTRCEDYTALQFCVCSQYNNSAVFTMFGSFKVPKLTQKQNNKPDLPKFEWAKVIKQKKLGSGSFGSVHLAKYVQNATSQWDVVVKKLKNVSLDSKTRFVKEATILNNVKGHRNITEFLGLCTEPYAIMMQYSCFNFAIFGVDSSVSSLADFLRFVDTE